MYEISYINNHYDKTVKHKNIQSIKDLTTTKGKNEAPLWYFGIMKERSSPPSKIGGFVIDWDSETKPKTSLMIEHYIHRTHNNNWRIIVPFNRLYKFTSTDDYTSTYYDMVSVILDPETELKPIDKKCISPIRAFYMRPKDKPIHKIGSKLYQPIFNNKPTKQIKNEIVITGIKKKIENVDEGATMLLKVENFYNYYKCILNWEFVKPENKKCIFDHHNSDKKEGDIAFNNPSPSIFANIHCYHHSCQEKIKEAMEVYQPINSKTGKTRFIYNATILYLALGVIRGIYSLSQIEACGFYNYRCMLKSLIKLYSLKYNPKIDVQVWLRILHERILIDKETGKIYDYDSDHYQAITEDRLKAYYHVTAGTYTGYKSGIKTMSYINDMIEYGKAIMHENYNNTIKGEGLCLKNGIVVLKENGEHEFKSHSYLYFFTHKENYSYQIKAECPVWLKCLKDYFGNNSEQINILQEYFGYCLTNDRIFEKFLVLYGRSRAGKNTIVETLMKMIPSEAYNLAMLCNPKERENILDKKLVFINEMMVVSRENTLNELKKLASTDPIMIRPLYQAARTVDHAPKIIISFNEAPENLKIDQALKNRMLAIKFTKSFLGREDRSLKSKLLKERTGILNWALEGYARLIKNKKFTEYNKDNDELFEIANDEEATLIEFVNEKIKEKSEWPSYELHLAYVEKYGNEISQKMFNKKLMFLGHEKVKTREGVMIKLCCDAINKTA